MSQSTMQQLAQHGQSAWLDFISRSMLDSGKLEELIQNGLRGMTSNPSIFNNAIGQTNEYDEQIIKYKHQGKSTFEIYDELTIKDIQEACDLFAEVYKKTNRLDGYVSLEINPKLANKVGEQIDEGLRLFKKVKRPNCMIKVPSTQEGFPVIEELIANKVNVNVTLIFSLEQYMETVQAYFRGLDRLSKKVNDLSVVRSVASVFVSRIDTLVDKQLSELLSKEKDETKKAKLQQLKGKAAVANCRIIFEKFKQLFFSDEFKRLFDKGANEQRVLWGSTSTKNPEYKDIKYVTELITKPTINTIPEKTLYAFLDHGEVKEAFAYPVEAAEETIEELRQCGIDIDKVCLKLLDDGVVAFEDAFEALMHSIEKKAAQLSLR
ncbi:MAG TPA: transaldolase [Candidatus Omnitrophota bacterium]|nr:transaldolase [Candidatus Omnitrophota bacterium]